MPRTRSRYANLSTGNICVYFYHFRSYVFFSLKIYACNLSEKAKELKREKRKSDILLFQMLPPSVATQLKQTQKVPAEYYDEVTVYFSDIVGFTEIAAECSPLEVEITYFHLFFIFTHISIQWTSSWSHALRFRW